MGSYDGVILGTGHNALVLQAYLSRCGLRTLAIERAATPGGGLATVENPRLPGFLHNTHSFFHRGITAMPWYRDLDLEHHGATYVEPELNVVLLTRDGHSLEWWRDVDRTVDSFASFSRRDADKLRQWADEFRGIVDRILVPESRSPPLEPAKRAALLGRFAAGRRLLEVSQLSPLEFVRREFENDTVRAGLLFFNGLREIDLRLAGFGHAIPALLSSPSKAQMCVGGSHRLARALMADIAAHGGEIRCEAAPRQLRVSRGRVVGVELDDGEYIAADCFVASGLNPQQTFLDLVPPPHLPREIRSAAGRFRYNVIAPLFTLDVALRDPPRYRAQESRPELEDAFMVILGLEGLDNFDAIVRAHERGTVAPPVAWGACPTRFDPSQAPEGRHTAFLWEKVPYRLHGDPRGWESATTGHVQRLLDHWAAFAPNLRGPNLLDAFGRSPVDTVNCLPNMREGDLLVGAFAHGQFGFGRPFVGAGAYRTPLAGLYLCGGSTHPGGNVTGLCGYNAAGIIADDLGCKVWWSRVDIEAALTELGDNEA